MYKYLDGFFLVRNDRKVKPVEFENYTEETLHYMTSGNRANEITRIITDRMLKKGFANFDILEICSGIGGNTMSFADNNSINHIMAFEKSEDRRCMLYNNLSLYDFQHKVSIADTFTQIPKQCNNSVIYVDPPWLQPDFTSFDKKNYILKDIHIGNLNMTDILNISKYNPLIVYRVPPGYHCETLGEYKFEQILLKNSLLIIAHRL